MTAGLVYRMPYGFGPSAGPRQGPDGRPFDWTHAPRKRSVAVSYLTDAALLRNLLPPGFSLADEPVVTVELQYFTELEWLAGRGYNTLGVKFPATFRGAVDEVTGMFLAVLWENLPDPILTGRDELGFAKLYADIPDPRIFRGREYHGAMWFGHRFIDIELDAIEEAPPASPSGPAAGGTLHYKYVPATGQWGEADVAYACHTPPGASQQRTIAAFRAEGTVTIHDTHWADMPTQFHIVRALAALPMIEARGAVIIETRGGKDLSDQRRLT
ncbi:MULTISPECIES: acetoacetate decarboxylase family protein [unclassified Chelatococcus]|uniref:acetoacetate decarboxylase family protein n=1 Tax=unclassified Chelatococcus TaxID=2638111 RepID=UPI001BCC477E|nr:MULTISPECIES: acetoacetate decarboxylase family protein [unclassified Chelatococcus]MBS7697171.1 acetoacetate decarboxylase family protein [Chelatococcus sp. YT9]MBX3556532.1 acetoacetate decarboxylase family protein [Chelatococcus sp.]